MRSGLRFGVQISSGSSQDPVSAAQRAEALGFDIVLVGEHVGPGRFSPFVTLAAIAAATTRIRIGTLVVNADMCNPVKLAWETTSLDQLSQGRFELGVGAGQNPHEYAATGLVMRSAADRKARLGELIEVVRRLLTGELISHDGSYFRLDQAQIDPPAQEHLPILVGGNGRALLHHAGAHADIVGLQGLGRTLADGHSHDVNWTVEHLERQLAQIEAGAAGRPTGPELSALVQKVEITDDAEKAIASFDPDLDAANALALPYLLVGTIDEIAGQVCAARDRFGVTYFVVREAEAFAPIVAQLRH